MPPIRRAAAHTQLPAPYPDPQASDLAACNKLDKDNQDVKNVSTSPVATSSNVESDTPIVVTSYHEIPLEEVDGEVPIYENATAIRRKLNKLINEKAKIPGSSKTFNKTTMAKELQTIAQAHHPIKTHNGMGNHGPSVPALTRFLKLSGGMRGADSESYYFGNMLLEKLRIWNGEKKTAARLKAENEFPFGRERQDPDHMRYICHVDGPFPTYSELANIGRR